MTPFELTYLGLEPLMSPLYHLVRGRLRNLIGGRRIGLLDVGGRRSHYTTGLSADVILTDLPRRSAMHRALNLGMTDAMVKETIGRRSNLRAVIYDDMTRSSLRGSSFEGAVAIEVLEHVDCDEQFVREVARVLRPGGFFLMTTPNGDSVPNHNPDHRRHYTRTQLETLLLTTFSEVRVEYAIYGGRFHNWSLPSWSARRPLRTGRAMVGGALTTLRSAGSAMAGRAGGTQHLLAVARVAGGER